MNEDNLRLKPFQMVLLIAGPAASGKSSVAEKIGAVPGWSHISEDDIWNEIGHPPEELRLDHEQVTVHKRAHERILHELSKGKSVAIEFILFHKPPQPLFDYQRFLKETQIRFETRVLRPSLEALIARASARGRQEDLNQIELFAANARHQLDCIAEVDPRWVVDDSGETFEASFEKHFRNLVESGRSNVQ